MDVVILNSPPGSVSLEIHNGFSSSLTAANVGSGIGVYKGTAGTTFEFKSLLAGGAVDITSAANEITIDIDEAYLINLIETYSNIVLAFPDRVAVSNGLGEIIASSITTTKLGYLSNVTSDIQAQFTTIAGQISTIGGQIAFLDLNKLSLSGGTMTGNIAMSGNKVTGLGAATANGQAVRYEQIQGLLSTSAPLNTLRIPRASSSNTIEDGSLTDDGTDVATNGAIRAFGGLSTIVGGPLWRKKIIQIGDWNMDTTSSVNVAHGLGGDWQKIRTVFALIRNDANTTYTPLDSAEASGVKYGYISAVNSTNVVLQRTSFIGYDGSSDYDGTSYNRGWVVIEYEV